ncbi:MAG TPA: 8-amino-7-oxononanoate synthase [Phycisphaerae bacterium]|nr:8-amino-7-oxononanoate synthase [Phycisphaerae bacterium]
MNVPESASPPPPAGAAFPAWLAALEESLQRRRDAHLLRELRPLSSATGPTVTIDGRQFVQFCTNNYLGLATDPEVIDAARDATARLGAGSGASRLVAGSLELHHELESALARLKHAEAALVFPTGFMANLAVLTTFAGEHDAIVSDKLNHASLLDAAKFSGAAHRAFPHRRYSRAAELLARFHACAPASRRFLVSDSVFSMDGDVADLPAACDAAERHAALVVIDEAHATGVLGARGAGLAEAQGVEERVAVTVGTLSKALGSLGGFVAGRRAVIETLVNAGRPFIYTTALPPACAGAALVALRIVEREPARRERVLGLAERVREELRGMGFDCGDTRTPIVPVILGEAEKALEAAAFLRERGIYVPAIRPPTVGPGAARLRVSLMATHSDGQVEQLLEAMRALRGKGVAG